MTRVSEGWRTAAAIIGAVLFASLACAAPEYFGSGASPTPSESPTPTSTPSPIPSPTPVPVFRLEDARKAQFNGDWQAAIDSYRAVIASGAEPALKAEAQLGLGATHLQAGNPEEAIAALSAFLDEYPDSQLLGAGYFHRASAYETLGMAELALVDFETYLKIRPGKIDGHVHELTGDLLRQVERSDEAILEYQSAVASQRLGGDLRLGLKIGEALFEAGDYGGAVLQFDQIQAEAADDSTKATANYLAGLALQAQGNDDAALARYLESLDAYPNAYDTYQGLILLVEAGIPVNEFQRGLIDYNAGAYEPALRAFDRFTAATPTSTGYYFRGLSKRALGDYQGALDDIRFAVEAYPDDPIRPEAWLQQAFTEWAYLDLYQEATQTYLDFVAFYPGSASAPEALFSAARSAERRDDLATASEIWLRLAREYPESGLAYQALFEAGIVLFRLGDDDAARVAFQQAESAASDPGKRAASLLWIGKTHDRQGDGQMASESWIKAADADPTGYYSVRAQDLLEGRRPFDSEGIFSFPADLEFEKAEAEQWLISRFGLTPGEPLDQLGEDLETDPRLVRSQEFWRLGLYGQAGDEFESLRVDYQSDPESTYRLMQEFLRLGFYRHAILASRQILQLAGMDDAATMTAPEYFNYVRFAPYYGEIILPEALERQVDTLYLLSLIRQESLFEGFATSYAAARGLMQVIPTTGDEIAGQLGWPDYQTSDLYRPVVSVEFGTYYLRRQLDLFDGDPFAALAAYNAGPGNALAWKALAPDDPDLFLEVIRLTQPHLYIRTIYEVHDIYKNLYLPP